VRVGQTTKKRKKAKSSRLPVYCQEVTKKGAKGNDGRTLLEKVTAKLSWGLGESPKSGGKGVSTSINEYKKKRREDSDQGKDKLRGDVGGRN